MEDALEELRDSGQVLLVIDTPPPRHQNEDGSPMVMAHDEDTAMAAMEFLSLQRVRVTRDPEEMIEAHAVVVVLTENWRSSKVLTREIVRARKLKRDLYFLNPSSMKLVRSN